VAGSSVVRAVRTLPEWQTDTLVLTGRAVILPVGVVGTFVTVECRWEACSTWVWVSASETSQIALLLTSGSGPAINASTLLAVLFNVEELGSVDTKKAIPNCGASTAITDRVTGLR
jgi:hypothetical protein